MIIKLKDIDDNPYRDLTLNALNEKKIEKLMESIARTGLWGVIVRKLPSGRFQLAFGHHRLAAAKRLGLTEANFIVEDLTNEQMLERLARDNDEVYNAGVLAKLETIRGAVAGLAEGTLKPFDIPKDTKKSVIRYAPSFTPGEEPSLESKLRPYTVLSLAKLLGYTIKHEGKGHNKQLVQPAQIVGAALDALYLMQAGVITKEAIEGMSVDALRIACGDWMVRFQEKRLQEAKKRDRQDVVNKIVADEKAFKAEAQAKIDEYQEQRDEANEALKEAKVAEDEAITKKLAKTIAKLDAQELEVRERLEKEGPVFAAHLAEVKGQQKEEEAATREAEKAARLADEVSTVLFRLQTIVDGGLSYTKSLKDLSKNAEVNTNQRQLVLNHLNSASTWFDERAKEFLPLPQLKRKRKNVKN